MPKVAIVTLTRFTDIFADLAKSVERYEPGRETIVVTSGEAGNEVTCKGPSGPPRLRGWRAVEGVEPFVFSRNANLGIAAAGDMDVLLTNDDVTLAEPMIDGLRNLSKTLPNVGVIAPTVIGGVGTIQQHAGRVKGEAFRSYRHLCFVCVYIPRKALNLVGPMDEQFHGYGGDDVDYCWRIRQAGLFLYIAPEFRVRHGHGDRSYSSSFLRVMDEQNRMCEMRAMDDILKRKWNGLARSIA